MKDFMGCALPHEQTPSHGEEIANAVSHGIGLAAALVGAGFLLSAAIRLGSAWNIIGCSVFAGAMVALYLSSTLYHALPDGGAKRYFRVLDHAAIFLLIAGTYTPITLGVLRGAWGWTLFGLVWGLAALGVTLKAAGGARSPRISTGLYLIMGWLILIAVGPLWSRMPIAGILWLLAGGLAYTGGVPFFAAERLPYHHFVWHLFVMAGTTCHFFAVLWFAA
jgi:hemolysin III